MMMSLTCNIVLVMLSSVRESVNLIDWNTNMHILLLLFPKIFCRLELRAMNLFGNLFSVSMHVDRWALKHWWGACAKLAKSKLPKYLGVLQPPQAPPCLRSTNQCYVSTITEEDLRVDDALEKLTCSKNQGPWQSKDSCDSCFAKHFRVAGIYANWNVVTPLVLAGGYVCAWTLKFN